MSRSKRSLKPRSRDSVENRNLDADAEGGRILVPRGVHYLNPKLSNVRLERLRSYKGGKTVFRIWNMLDPENPGSALLNGRLSALDTAGLGGMSISEPVFCVSYAGLNPKSGLPQGENADQCSYIIARSKSGSYDGIQFWDLPYPKLFTVATRAYKCGKFGDGRSWDPSWNILLAKDMNAALKPFKQLYFVVCSLYENGSNLDLTRERVVYKKQNAEEVQEYPRDGVPLGEMPNDPLVVLELTASAGKKLLEQCNVEKADYVGDESVDPSIPFKYGDPCGKFNAEKGTVKGGVFFTIFNPDAGKVTKEISSYDCTVSKEYIGPSGPMTASLSAEKVDNIFNKNLFLWKDSDDDPDTSFLLHEPSIEERCLMLAKAFKLVPKLLEYCWMSSPEYLAFDSVKAVLKNRTVVSKPAVVADVDDDDDDDEDEDAPAPAKKPKSSAGKTKPVAPAKRVAALVDEMDDDEDDEDDEDEDEIDEDDLEDEEEAEDEDDVEADDDDDDADEEDEDDEDDEEDEDEDDEDEDDDTDEEFDSFDDEDEEEDSEDEKLEDQLKASLSKAKARGKHRESKPPRKK